MGASQRKRLGEILLDAGVIDATQLQGALAHQRRWGVRLGQALVDMRLTTESDIVHALARKFGYEVARLGALEPRAREVARGLVPREFAARNNVYPMYADSTSIVVAMSDPTNLAVVDELRFRTGRKVKVCIAGDREVAEGLKALYPADAGVQAIALDLDVDDPAGETVLDDFVGGGSSDAIDAFFGRANKPGRAAPAPAPRPAGAPAAAERTLSDQERAILAALERLAGGAHAEPEIVKPAQLIAVLARLLIRRGVVSERELLDELQRR